jgi:crotonobetainyl-CoA:carnitine CoA-transferase CaiB-like acyl-CoA transferase
VLDLSQYVAGPVATRILADLGATVIKVEAPGRVDPIRSAAARQAPMLRLSSPIDDESAPNTGALFNYLARGKLGLGLDFRATAGRDALQKLAASCDVVVENFAAGVAARYGAGWDELSTLNPRLCLLSMPFYGSEGPRASWVGFGQSTESASGLAWLTGYPNDMPRLQGGLAYGDPTAGVYGALGVLAALNLRARDGRGRRIDLSQVEALASQVGLEAVAARELAWRPSRLTGSAEGRGATLRCAGDDQWVWAAAGEDELPPAVVSGARGTEATDVVRQLRDAGVLAVKCADAADLIADRHAVEGGLIIELDHPVVGIRRYPGFPARLDGQPLPLRRAGPCFGEHNDAILEAAGLPPDDVRRLREAGVLADHPTVLRPLI